MKNKKKISPDKRAQVLGRRLVFEVASDFILSLAKDGNYEKILSLNNQDGYITKDYVTDFCSVFDMILLKVNIPSDIKKLFSKLSLFLASVSSTANRIKIYDDITAITKQIKNEISEKDYFLYSRQIYLSCYFSDYIAPVFMVLDYIFYSDGLIWGETESKLIKKEFKAFYNNCYWPIPLCLAGAIDNMNLANSNDADFLKFVVEYVQVSCPMIKSQIKGNANLGAILQFVCSISRMYNKLACRNKFLFDYNKEFLPSDIQAFSRICNKISIEYREICSAFRNILKELDPKVFTQRKYIFKNTSFPDLAFQLETDDDILTFDNFSIFERHHKTENEDFFMIYVSYSVNGAKSTLPICVDNFLASIGGFGETDFFVFFLVLTLYGIEDCIPESILQTELQDIISIAKDNVENNVEHRGENKTSGYHQTKEVHVDAFIRRLPAGQKASDSAKELAKYYGVNLGENNTIVSEYTKNKK